jgi:hypothetical protein
LPAAKRVRIPASAEWDTLPLHLLWPEQQAYERIRPVVVVGLPPAERALQTGAAAHPVARRSDLFEASGFAGLRCAEATSHRVPAGIRDALLLLTGAYPARNPHERVTIAAVRFGRRLSDHTVQRLLATGPVPTAPARRFLSYHQLHSGTERRLAIGCGAPTGRS